MLDKVSVHLRPRVAWESLDLGFALARKHFWELLGRWLQVFLPFWLLLAALLHSHPGWFLAIVWWLKPWYARVPLWVISQRLFGFSTSSAEFRKALPKLLFKNNLFALTFGRFSFRRSFVMPIRVLENSTGHIFSQRVTRLAMNGIRPVVWARFLFTFLSSGFVLGMGYLILRYAPNYLEEIVMTGQLDFSVLWNNTGGVWIFISSGLVGITLTEIFHVAGGFGVYLNSRAHLEGWDLEIAFQSLADRFRKLQGLASLVITSLTLGLFFSIASPAAAKITLPSGVRPVEKPAHAQHHESVPSRSEIQKEAKDILAHPDFKIHEHEEDVEVASPPSPPTIPSFNLSGLISGVLYTLVGGILVTLIWFICRTYKPTPRLSKEAQKQAPALRVVAGQEISPEKLPQDIPSAALAALQAGHFHEAIRLLYAGSLRWMLTAPTYQFPLRASDTEGDCLRHWHATPDGPQKSYFQKLTDHWLLSAYASLQPQPDQLQTLISRWPFDGKNADLATKTL